jgi:hypothetical protein
MEERDKIRSPLLRYLYRLMDAPIDKMSVFYVCGVFLTVGLLLPFGLLHERFIQIREVKPK